MNPIAVLISDIHFGINTLTLASKALKQALAEAEILGVPLVIAGDLNDTKAIIRGEVANALIEIFKLFKGLEVFVLVGNHDLLNEKGKEHSLNFLRPYVTIVDRPFYEPRLNSYLIPYTSDNTELKSLFPNIPLSITAVIMHQGFLGAKMGEYIQDKSSISPKLVKDFTVISGHYHSHQTLDTVTYIGTPYTVTFSEANDPPKGFLILNEDGSYTKKLTNLRKHVIVERDVKDVMDSIDNLKTDDLLWLKVSGPTSQLKLLNKKDIGLKHLGHSNFKLDLMYKDSAPLQSKTDTMTGEQILDSLIDEAKDQVTELKALWRELV